MKCSYNTFISDQGVKIDHFTIQNELTLRGYFGHRSWLPDESGFICGKTDGSFYYYNVAEQELVYLDKTFACNISLPVSVHPINGLVYYRNKNSDNCSQLFSIDPKTGEKKLIYTADDPRVIFGLEVTNDERYVHYVLNGERRLEDGELMEFGRIDLQSGKIDLKREYGFAESNCINHFMLNPVYPNLLLFHHEAIKGILPQDRLNIMDLETGKVITYKQPGKIAAHAMWTLDGENVTLTDYHNGTRPAIVDKNFENHKSYLVEPEYGGANHSMFDGNGAWALCDDFFGVALLNLKTEEKTALTTKLEHSRKGHPYHAHAEISKSGKICSWGDVNEDGVLGIAWTTNPYLN